MISEALAQSSLGLGRSEQAIQPSSGGIFSSWLFWIQQQQQAFYKSMVDALTAMKSDQNQIWWLVLLSFTYGVFHAAGPGHGKAVVSSYMLANEVAAKRGIVLSFASSILQGITAIAVITILLLFLRGTGIRSDNLTGYLEVSSYFLVMVLGLYLIWTKIIRNNHHSHDHGDNHEHNHSHASSLALGHVHAHSHSHSHKHSHNHASSLVLSHTHNHDHKHDNHNQDHHHKHDHDHDHHHGAIECGCGHSHAADPRMLEENPGLRGAWSAILAVGVRPCTGAIVVLTFAFLNGLYLAGLLSTLAMSIGTGITVASLALLAVAAKNTAMRVAKLQDKVGLIHKVIEGFGAVLVFLLGFLLFTAAMAV